MNYSSIRLILALFLFCITPLLTGCWDRTEVNDLAIVTAFGVDKATDKLLELSVAVYIPKSGGESQQMQGGSGGGGGGSNQQVVVRSATGITIADAMSKLQQKFPRRLFWGHATVVIFSKEVAKEGLPAEIDFILRHPEVRERANIFISKQKAKDVLNLSPPMETSLAKVLLELSKLKIGMDITVKDLSEMFLSESRAAAVPYIEILPSEGYQSENQTISGIIGTAVFKDGKMIGTINANVTRGVLWLRNEIELAVVTIKPKNTNGYISMQLLNAKTQLKPRIKNGRWKITLKAETEDDIVQNDTNLDTMDPKIINELEKELSIAIESRIRNAVNQAKDMNDDIFNFAGAFHRAYPDEWKKNKNRWYDIFPDVKVAIDVKAKIKRPGMTTSPQFSMKRWSSNEIRHAFRN